MNINEFLKDRREAFTAFVMKDDYKAIVRYCQKYKVEIPKDERIAKVGVYKAVYGCTDLPKEVIDTAVIKCLKLGFSPLINPETYEVE